MTDTLAVFTHYIYEADFGIDSIFVVLHRKPGPCIMVCTRMWRVCLLFYVGILVENCNFCFGQNAGGIEVSEEVRQCYSRAGDINIGYLTTIRAFGESYDTCSEELGNVDRLQYVEAFRYTVEEVNNNPDILPNVTLGFVIMDACERDLTALTQSMRFLPLETTGEAGNTSTRNNYGTCGEKFSSFDVVGIVGPRASRMSVMVSSVLGIFHIPVLATFSTSDELSDKSRFPYFIRLVPPDRFQAKAIIDFIEHFGWTYISLVFSTGSYGENGAKLLEAEAKERDMCMPYSGKIPSDATEADYDFIVDNVFSFPNAKAVIVFLSTYDGRGFFHSAGKRSNSIEFVWIGGDDLQYEYYGAPSDGMFTFHFAVGEPTDFFKQYQTLTPSENQQDPWMPDLWQMLYQCTWGDSVSDNTSCEYYSSQPYPDQLLTKTITIPMDGVMVYAWALHNLMSELCPQAFSNPSLARNCVEGPDLLRYMKQVEFEGRSTNIKFDERGDMLGQYVITQYLYQDGNEVRVPMARWAKDTESLYVSQKNINWTLYQMERDDNDVPIAICSMPCKPKQIYVHKELYCCWDCRTCRENEIITANQSMCESCQLTYWPDEETATICKPISPIFVHFSDSFAIGLVGLTCLGMLVLITTIIIYILNWSSRLIKATSRELSMMTLIGIFLAFCTVFAFLAKPNLASCRAGHYGFNLSVALIYAPLLVKTNRLYRIFTGGKEGKKNMKFIGNRFQLITSLMLVLVQVRWNIQESLGP